MSQNRVLLILAAIGLAALARLIPHPPNFTPLLAMALFGGAMLADRRVAVLATLAAMFVSDLWIGLHGQIPVVYGSLVLAVLMGGLLRNRRGVVRLAAVTVSGSLIFFLLTNLGVWLFDGLYPHSLDGLVACYAMALPFYQNGLAGDLFYSAVLFGGFTLAERHLYGSAISASG